MMSHPLKRPLIVSATYHLIILLTMSFFPSLSLRNRPLSITWVELPRGTSSEIETNIKKAPELPKSTIEQQKQPATTEQKPLPPVVSKNPVEAKPVKQEKPIMPQTAKKAPPPKRLSPEERKIQEALKGNDRDLASRSVPPEAAQVKESGNGFQYGLGSKPLRIAPTDPEYLKYQAEVRTKLINEWIIPPRYAEDGSTSEFHAQVEVLITLDGEVASLRWVARSGNAAFDASVTRAVQRSSPFPKPPERLAWEAYNEGFLIEFDPRLKP